jgi:hypothetical protein
VHPEVTGVEQLDGVFTVDVFVATRAPASAPIKKPHLIPVPVPLDWGPSHHREVAEPVGGWLPVPATGGGWVSLVRSQHRPALAASGQLGEAGTPSVGQRHSLQPGSVGHRAQFDPSDGEQPIEVQRRDQTHRERPVIMEVTTAAVAGDRAGSDSG